MLKPYDNYDYLQDAWRETVRKVRLQEKERAMNNMLDEYMEKKEMNYQRIIDAEPFTEVSVSTPYGTYTVSVPEADHPISEFMNDLVIPVLLAMGYSEVLVDKYRYDS
jgi:hypothetical protein